MEQRKEAIRAIKFTIISISAGLVQISSFTLLNELIKWPYWPCYLISITLSVLWNFTINRRYTFKSANNVPVAMAKVLAFYAVFTPITLFGGNHLVEVMHWNEYLVTALTMVLNFVLEFLFQRYYVFKKSLDTNDLAQPKGD
ncbi:MAG TPA: GtrA family protein [Acholeplasmatales bacterium]|nr:MAG: hypothetical protein A2Y16_00305 [Tenericutes bacterium GWF2_57_13]HAQ55989.1 GtrA family protein [Acholeplasmatales bacterium]